MTQRERAASAFDPNPPPDVADEDVPSDPAVVPESGLSLSELLGEIQWPMVPGWAAGQAPDEATGRTGGDQAPNDSAAD